MTYRTIAVKPETKEHFELIQNDLSQLYGHGFTQDEVMDHLLNLYVQEDLARWENIRDEEMAPRVRVKP